MKEAIGMAIDVCINENIMAEFLTKNREEVLNMELLEKSFDLFLERKVERGMELGREQGIIEIVRNMFASEVPIDDIVKFSGMSLDKVEGLVD